MITLLLSSTLEFLFAFKGGVGVDGEQDDFEPREGAGA